MTDRRDVLLAGFIATALAGLQAPPAAGAPAVPWARRVFHMFTGPDGQSRIRRIPVPPPPKGGGSARLLRRPAERVTIGTMAPGYMMDFHIANQPNILVPLFGSLVVKLKDGSEWVFRLGDILFAEDCSGGGHMSGAGLDGCFSISVQIPSTEHCLDSMRSPADVLTGGDGNG